MIIERSMYCTIVNIHIIVINFKQYQKSKLSIIIMEYNYMKIVIDQSLRYDQYLYLQLLTFLVSTKIYQNFSYKKQVKSICILRKK